MKHAAGESLIRNSRVGYRKRACLSSGAIALLRWLPRLRLKSIRSWMEAELGKQIIPVIFPNSYDPN